MASTKIKNEYCSECNMPRLFLDKSCLFCHPELVKNIYQKKNLDLLKGLVIFYLITNLLIYLLLNSIFPNVLTKLYTLIPNLIMIGSLSYFLSFLITMLLPIIIRFVIYKKPINNFKSNLLSIVNSVLLIGISSFITNRLEISVSIIVLVISQLIMNLGYDKRLEEIENL